MKVELYHASKFGNGAKVAEELKRVMEAKGHQVNAHHVKESKPKEVAPADLYVFGSPTRMGKPIGSMRKFAKKVVLPSGTKYAVFATHGEAVPNKKTGHLPTDEEMKRFRQTIPILDEILGGKGLVKIAEKRFFVSGDTMKGHLIDGWQAGVEEFAKVMIG
jgi:menaquinone-dependent protoporphyrinogen IX oxidase